MSNNELLLAISDMLDIKLKSQLEPIKKDISIINNEITKTNFILEHEIKPDIRLLAENYLPSATRYDKSLSEMGNMKADVVIKRVVTEHSEKLQKIS